LFDWTLVETIGRFLNSAAYFNLASALADGTHAPPMVRECPRNSAIAVSSTVTRTS
jgi:hypothetical protein